MVKVFELLIRRSDVSHEQCLALLTRGGESLRGVAGVLGFTVQEALPLPARKDIVQLDIPADVDAFAEIWVESVEAYEVLLDSPVSQEWRASRIAACAMAKTLVLTENPLIPVPEKRPPTRNNAFLTRNAQFETREAFLHEWLVGHGDMCLTIPYLRGFVPCVVEGVLPQKDIPEMRTDAIEGIAQAYFDTPEDEIAMIQTPEAKEWFAHGAITFGLIKAFGAKETASHIPAPAQGVA